MLKKLMLLIGLVVMLSALSGCDSNNSGGAGADAPSLFSSDLFTMDTELFSGVGTKSGKAKLNFFGAAARVWPVSLGFSLHTAIPVAITNAALQSTPKLEGGVWSWERTITAENGTYEFILTGEPTGSSVDWAMSISSSAPVNGEMYSGFVLFEGTTDQSGGTGTWSLYYPMEGERTNVLNATFHRADEDTRQLTFRIPAGVGENGGDTVFYQADGLIRSFLWTQSSRGFVHDIEWNSHTNEGSIQADNHLGGVLSCWDTYLDDVACP